MAAPTKVNNPNVEVLINHKQSELPSENTLETPDRPIKDQLLKIQKICQQLQKHKHDKRGIVAHQWVKKVVVHQSVTKKIQCTTKLSLYKLLRH